MGLESPKVNATVSGTTTATAINADDLEVDSGTLSVDADNNRVGINTESPAKTLSVDGDMHFQPTATSTAHLTTAGSLKIQATNNIRIGDDGADSIRLGRINSTACKVHLRSGADTNLVISDNKVGIGTDSPTTTLHVEGVVNVGVNDAGHDVVFYGDTASANVTWDASEDDLIASGAARVVVPDGQLVLGSTAITSTAAELNLLDGVSGLAQADFTKLAAVDSSAAELNILDGKAFLDEDNMASDSATGIASQQSIKAYVDSQTSGAGNMDNWILEDDDGTEVTVSNGKEVKFIGSGLTTNFTDTDNGTDADPYDLTFTVDAAQTGITSVVNASLEVGRDADNRIKFGTDNQIIFEVDGGDNVIFKTSGEIEATSLDISGDADIDGTLEADAITVGGTALNTVIAGVTVTNATTAAVATTVTISDNESTNEENAVIFTAGGDVDGGNIGLESDGDLTYNPSTGTLSATILKGNVDAVDGDFDGTLEADAITVGGTNLLTGGVVTSLGTITQDTVTFTSANANDPQLFIKNTTNDANGPVLVLENDRGANNGADNDVCGIIEFKGTDDASAQTTFAMVSATVKDASNGAEGGEFGIEVATHDGELQFGLKITDGDAEDELDVSIGSGVNSVTTAAGYIKGANGVLIPEGTSVHIETPMLASADHTATGITTLMTASENIAQGELVYASGDGTIGVADADAVAKMPAIGLAVAAISSGNPGAILLRGMFRDDSYGFTAGNRLFVHTDGTVTATAPSGNGDVAQAVGVALEPDVIYFSPDMTLVEITA